MYVRTRVEGNGCARRYRGGGTQGTLNGRLEQVSRSRKVDWLGVLGEILVERVPVVHSWAHTKAKSK